MAEIKKGERTALIMTLVLVMVFSAAVPSHAKERKIHTYYTGLNTVGTGLCGYTMRYRVRSYYLGKNVSYSKKREIGVVKNNTNRPATKSLSLSKSTSRTFSMSVSAAIPKKVLESDISATIGGALSYNNTITISASAEVDPHDEKSVYLRYKYSKSKYKYVVQRQIKKMYGTWKNYGKPYTKYNTSTTKVPVLVL